MGNSTAEIIQKMLGKHKGSNTNLINNTSKEIGLSVIWAEEDFCQWLLTETNKLKIKGVLDRASPEFFELEQAQAIVKTCVSLFAKGLNEENSDGSISISEFLLCAKDIGARVGSTDELAAILNKNQSLDKAQDYASDLLELIIDSYSRRKLRQSLQDQLELLANTSYANASEMLLELAQDCMQQANAYKPQKEPDHISESIGSLLESISGQTLTEKPVPTGFRDIDNATIGGLRGGELIILAGRPGMGKTALALAFSKNVGFNYTDDINAKKVDPTKVLFFSGEMPNTSLASRMVSSESGIMASRLRSLDKDALLPDDYERLAGAVPRFTKPKEDAPDDGIRLWMDDTPGMSLAHVKRVSREFVRKHGRTLIIIDYLQLIAAYSGKDFNRKGESAERQNVASTSNQLKALARDLDCPVIALAQLNRSLEKRTNKVPILSDLREAGEIEQDADIIMFLYRDIVYNEEASPNDAQLIIAKQRDGGTGVIQLNYEPEFVRFTSVGFNRGY